MRFFFFFGAIGKGEGIEGQEKGERAGGEVEKGMVAMESKVERGEFFPLKCDNIRGEKNPKPMDAGIYLTYKKRTLSNA